MARPKKDISAAQVKRLARLSCTMLEIAAVVGCSVDTLERRFADVIKEGQEHCKMSLRRQLVRQALKAKPHPAVLIFANKVITGLRENDTPSDPDAPARTRGAVIRTYRDGEDDHDGGDTPTAPPN